MFIATNIQVLKGEFKKISNQMKSKFMRLDHQLQKFQFQLGFNYKEQKAK